MAVQGRVRRLNRKSITAAIAARLLFPAPTVPGGSTVGNDFLTDVLLTLGEDPSASSSTYRKLERVLHLFGEPYDKQHDSSEHAGRSGGGTITNQGFRKILRGVEQEPQCFILNIADHPVSGQYADVPGQSYGFSAKVSGRINLLQAGPGSRVVFYSTRKATATPKQCFIAHAVISAIDETAPGEYRARLESYEVFARPLPVTEVDIVDWNRRHGIAEIDYSTLRDLVLAAGLAITAEPLTAPVSPAVIDEAKAQSALSAVADIDAEIDLSGKSDAFPTFLPQSVTISAEPTVATDPETPSRRGRSAGPSRRALDRYIEQRAVSIAKQYLAGQGWELRRDRQKDGVGYDLDYGRTGGQLHVEVKGLQGDALEFNLTAREWTRVATDPEFVVIAVTGVLRDATVRVHVLTRDRLAGAARRATQYRLTLGN